jgi:SnoaL-like polyketide cyclase
MVAAPAVAQSGQKSIEQYRTAERIANQNLKTFDNLDFDVFTNQNWDRLKESHSPDVIVHWPDGRETRGIDKHIEDLKWLFTFAPDTRIKVHPVKVAGGGVRGQL